MVCGVNDKCIPVGGCLHAVGIPLEGQLGNVIWDYVDFLFFAGVKKGHSRVKWQHRPALALLSVAWSRAVCVSTQLEVMGV